MESDIHNISFVELKDQLEKLQLMNLDQENVLKLLGKKLELIKEKVFTDKIIEIQKQIIIIKIDLIEIYLSTKLENNRSKPSTSDID